MIEFATASLAEAHEPSSSDRAFAGRRRSVVAVAIVVIALLGSAQILLPGIAADRLRSHLSQHGQVLAVSVSAFPAIELLWGQADSVTVRMSSYSDRAAGAGAAGGGGSGLSPQRRLADLLARTANTGSLDVVVARFQSGPVRLDDVVVSKRGDQLAATALLTDSHLQAALPAPFALRPLQSPAGQLRFHGSVVVAGAHLSATARLQAHDGSLVLQPDLGGLFPSVLSLSVFRDPRVSVQSVGARRVAGGWQVSAVARLTNG